MRPIMNDLCEFIASAEDYQAFFSGLRKIRFSTGLSQANRKRELRITGEISMLSADSKYIKGHIQDGTVFNLSDYDLNFLNKNFK
jgi:hypothetical protein